MRLLEAYRPGEPFHLYLKNYFARNRKHGSTDRRILRDLCYAYFRIGRSWREMSTALRVASAYYLVSPDPMPLLTAIHPEWTTPNSNDLQERAQLLSLSLDHASIFPWVSKLSSSIDPDRFIPSLLRQPDLFIRIRPGQGSVVREMLNRDAIVYREISDDCLALSNTTSLESRFEMDRTIVVQDRSSQRVGELMRSLPARAAWTVWDACAASGGKSILLNDILPNIHLSCTDLRGSILNNLQARLGRAAVPLMRVRADDLTRMRDRSDWGFFDLILADVPCSGSGTWARTPEQFYYFDPLSLDQYIQTQRAIMQQVVKQLSPGGYVLYMTCSVFAAENEEQVNWVTKTLGLELVAQKMFEGYTERADTLFGALLKRSS